MPYIQGWGTRKENYANAYCITGGTVTTAVQGEQVLNPVVVYSVNLQSIGAAGGRLQLVNASTTADAAVASSGNIALDMSVSATNNNFLDFPKGIFFSKGCVINLTATSGSASLTLYQFRTNS